VIFCPCNSGGAGQEGTTRIHLDRCGRSRFAPGVAARGKWSFELSSTVIHKTPVTTNITNDIHDEVRGRLTNNATTGYLFLLHGRRIVAVFATGLILRRRQTPYLLTLIRVWFPTGEARIGALQRFGPGRGRSRWWCLCCCHRCCDPPHADRDHQLAGGLSSRVVSGTAGAPGNGLVCTGCFREP